MRYWLQRSALLAAIVLMVSACAGDVGAEVTPPSTTASTTSQAPSPTTGAVGDSDQTTTTGSSVEIPQVDGPAAPDFLFALADGSSFSLSDEQKPVYLVFWAEW